MMNMLVIHKVKYVVQALHIKHIKYKAYQIVNTINKIQLIKGTINHMKHNTCFIYNRVASPYQRPLPTQNTTNTRDEHPVLRRILTLHHNNQVAAGPRLRLQGY